ncbi:MAG: inner-rane translocator [Ilumatobacteraceae bacterium]|nr:inner-rane translocator [Ilumatobacteraceae bacterium]
MALVKITQNTPAHWAYRAIRWAVVAAALLYVPWFAHQPARIDQFTQVAAFAVALLGLNLVMGFAGQISLGHSAFVGLGGYITVILVAKHDWGYLQTIPVVIVICFIAGCIVGLPALRISGLYMAVVTLAVGAVFPIIVLKYDGLTGGANGVLAKNKMLPPSWTPFDAHSRFGPVAYRYLVVLLVAVVMFVLTHNLVRGRIGRAIIALRDNSTGAAVSGVNLGVVRTVLFGISAALGGVAGTLLIIQLPQATDGRFGLELAIFLVVALFAGGTGRTSGAVPGALIYVFLPYYAIEWAKHISFLKGPGASSVSGVIYGVLLLIFVFVLPGGVVDGLRRAWGFVFQVIPRPMWLMRYRGEAPLGTTAHGGSPPMEVDAHAVDAPHTPDATGPGSVPEHVAKADTTDRSLSSTTNQHPVFEGETPR